MATDHPFSFNARVIKDNNVQVASTKLSAMCTTVGWTNFVSTVEKLADPELQKMIASEGVKTASKAMIEAAAANVAEMKAHEAKMATAFKEEYSKHKEEYEEIAFAQEKASKLKHAIVQKRRDGLVDEMISLLKSKMSEEEEDKDRPGSKKRKWQDAQILEYLKPRLVKFAKEFNKSEI